MAKTFIILGSGSTAYGGFYIEKSGKKFIPPMDQNFFETPIVKLIYNKSDYPALYFFQNLQTINSLEKTWSDIDICSKLTNGNNEQCQKVISMKHDYEKLKKLIQKKESKDENFKHNLGCQLIWVKEDGCLGPLADWEVKEIILKLFKDLRPKKESSLLKLVEKISLNSELSGIATFNYDLSLENIWNTEKIKKKLYYYDPESSGLVNGIPFYKLHGSINWKSEFFSGTPELKKWVHEIPRDITHQSIELKYEKGINIGQDHQPIKVIEHTIIPPVSFKQNIALDLQTDPRSLLFKRIWNEMWEELANVEILIFIGLSFPEIDHHARALFSSAHRRKPFKKVIINTGSDKSVERYMSVFDKNVVIPFNQGIDNFVMRQDELVILLK